jgi:hypothetical protein
MRYLLIIAALFCSLPQISAQNNIAYGAGISYTNGAPSFTPPARTSRVAIDTITGKWYHYNTPGGWQLLGNTIEEIAGCSAPAYTPTKGDSKVVINNCTNPELYYWTGSAWVWINEGTTYYAGEGIRIQNDSIILDSLYYLQFRTGDTTDLDAGRLSWNAQEGTLDVVINSGNVTGQVFEDVFFNCKNQTGSTINRGTVVMAVGTLGASGRILIAPAIADGSVNSEYILGTAAQDITSGSDGLVYHFGKDRGLNTTGASCGETWADRDVLYCSATTPGCLTKVLPTAPNLKVPVAFVIRAGNNGTLFIRPSHFPDLNQINDVQLTSPTTGQTLIYNASTGVWSNQTPADPSSTNELQTLSTGTNTLTLSNGGGTVTVDTDPASDVTGSGTSGQVSFWTGAQTQSGDNGLWWDNAAKRLGVNTAAPSFTLDVVGQSRIGGNFDLSTNTPFFVTGSRSDRRITNTSAGSISSSVGYFAGTVDMRGSQAFTGFNGMTFSVNNQNTSASNNITAGNFTVSNDASNAGLSRGIGIVGRFVNVSNIAANDIRCVQSDVSNLLTGSTISNLYLYRAEVSSNLGSITNTFGYYVGDITAGTQANTPYSFYAVDANTLNYFAGNTGVGQTTPAARLHVVGSGSTSTTWTAQFHNSAGNNNALMVRNDGIVSIGTASPNGSGVLEISSTTQGVLLPRMTTAQRDLITTPADGLVIYNTTTNKLQVRAAGVWVDLH